MSVDPVSPPPDPAPGLVPHNPYAPPAVPPSAEPPLERVVSGGSSNPFGDPKLKWIYLGAAVISYATLASGLLLGGSMRVVSSVVVLIAALVEWVARLAWLHLAWATRPVARAHRDVTAGGAVGRLFIPFYGFYWFFAVTLEIAASIDPQPLGKRSPGQGFDLDALARTACALQVLVFAIALTSRLGPLAGAGVVVAILGFMRTVAWLLFMFRYERRRGAAS